jgi:hypothetical protein
VRADDGQAQTDLTAEVDDSSRLWCRKPTAASTRPASAAPSSTTPPKSAARAQQALAALDSARSRRDSLERRRGDLLPAQEVYTQLPTHSAKTASRP